MKAWLSFINFILGVGTGVLAYFAKQPYWQPFLVNVSTGFLFVGWGIMIVDIYLERKARQSAIGALLLLSHESIDEFHNTFLEMFWDKIGKAGYGKIIAEYQAEGRHPKALSPESRNKFYEIIKAERDKLADLLEKLDLSLSEVCRLIGWSLDAGLLGKALIARREIQQFRLIKFDDSEDAKLAVVEHLLDADAAANGVRKKLYELAGQPSSP